MVSLNKSFVYGICVASITWAICLYLFWQLNQTDTLTAPFTSIPINNNNNNNNNKDYLRSNNVIDIDNKHGSNKLDVWKKNFGKSYENSADIIKKLQPLGKRGHLDELGMVKNADDRRIKDEGTKLHAFNVLVSNQLSYHRTIPDTRNKLCQKQNYFDNLPNASVIICFYNEHNNTLLRSIHSILDRTPANLLHEIILVNDFSDVEGLHEQIAKYIEQNLDANKVKLFKTPEREGLIRARIFGSRKATGKALIFLDSHIEVNVDWIQPLLTRIQINSKNVAMPVIDMINADTFAYSSSPLVRGGFNWGLHFKWENLPTGTLSKEEDFVKPIKSPTMAGGLFAINRKYFIDLGEYDSGMNIWGGENLEISFRIWMCGGSLELIPCSRVGHVFRQRRPYSAPDGQDTMLYNSLRVANVWMDDYKKYFYEHVKSASKVDYGDITSRIQLRKELKCQDFDWYLKNIYPELALPTDNEERLKKKWAALEQDKYQPWHSRKRNYIKQYQIRLSESTLCLQSAKDFKTKGSALELRPCMRSKPQIWHETDKGELVLAQLLCLQANERDVMLYKCHEGGGDQEWKHKGENLSPIYNMASGRCLGVSKMQISAKVQMTMCNDKTYNKWDLVET